MIKVCIILPKGLPVPNVKGGAIETIITNLINQNEIYKKLDITVASVYDNNAYIKSKEYKYTKFIYIENNFKYKIKAIKVRILNLFKHNYNTYNEVILDKIENNNYDYILVEDGAYFSFESYLKYFKKEQMLLHFHHHGKSDKNTDNTYSTFMGVSDFVTNKFKKNSIIPNFITLKNCIDIDIFNKNVTLKERNEIRKKVGFNKNDFVVMYCGRIIKEKGVLELIHAINKIDNKNIKLMIVGSVNFGNNVKSEYLEQVNKEIINSNNKIKATGYINQEELYKYYKSADICVIPSLCEEAALLVNLEAMASSLPTIITKTGGACEYISEYTIVLEKNDQLIDNIKDNILKLYNDEKLRNKMIKEGLKVSNKYTLTYYYKNFIKTLERIGK